MRMLTFQTALRKYADINNMYLENVKVTRVFSILINFNYCAH